jgi:hypothetical protein
MLPGDVKENLLATDNGGRIVEMEPHKERQRTDSTDHKINFFV